MGKEEIKGAKRDKSKNDRKREKTSNGKPEDEKDYGGIPKRDLKRNISCG